MVPPILNAGDTWKFSVSYPNYPAHAGWSALLVLASRGDPLTFAGTTASNGSDYDFLIASTATIKIANGPYTYRVIVTGSGICAGQSFTAEQSRVMVAPSFANPYDGTSVAEGQLKLCNDAIAAVLAGGVASGSFGNQSFSSLSLSELLKMKTELLATIKGEAIALNISQGLGSGRNILVRFKNNV